MGRNNFDIATEVVERYRAANAVNITEDEAKDDASPGEERKKIPGLGDLVEGMSSTDRWELRRVLALILREPEDLRVLSKALELPEEDPNEGGEEGADKNEFDEGNRGDKEPETIKIDPRDIALPDGIVITSIRSKGRGGEVKGVMLQAEIQDAYATGLRVLGERIEDLLSYLRETSSPETMGEFYDSLSEFLSVVDQIFGEGSRIRAHVLLNKENSTLVEHYNGIRGDYNALKKILEFYFNLGLRVSGDVQRSAFENERSKRAQEDEGLLSEPPSWGGLAQMAFDLTPLTAWSNDFQNLRALVGKIQAIIKGSGERVTADSRENIELEEYPAENSLESFSKHPYREIVRSQTLVLIALVVEVPNSEAIEFAPEYHSELRTM